MFWILYVTLTEYMNHRFQYFWHHKNKVIYIFKISFVCFTTSYTIHHFSSSENRNINHIKSENTLTTFSWKSDYFLRFDFPVLKTTTCGWKSPMNKCCCEKKQRSIPVINLNYIVSLYGFTIHIVPLIVYFVKQSTSFFFAFDWKKSVYIIQKMR